MSALKKAALKLAQENPEFRKALKKELSKKASRHVADVDGNYMSRQALRKLADQAAYLLSVIDSDTPMEDWMEAKIVRSSGMLNGVYDYMKYRDYEGIKMAAMPNGSVRAFLMLLNSKITQYDRRNSRKPGYNPNALGHYFGASNRVEKALGEKLMDSEDPKALALLKRAIERNFIVPSFSPAKYVIKQIDKFLATGQKPSLTRRAGE